ncbi:MAG TPA: hypothetical protein VHG91_08985, partial [Longimicrobium sp.]|nr:hypothetical protein [Longimicrobium sp.]
PLMPDFGARLLADLDADVPAATWDDALGGVRPGARVRLEAAAYFPDPRSRVSVARIATTRAERAREAEAAAV